MNVEKVKKHEGKSTWSWRGFPMVVEKNRCEESG